MNETIEKRFWAKVDRRGPDECWEWTGARRPDGYGVINPGRHSGPAMKAHRLSAKLAGLAINGRFVLHACDNPPCVNPSHLRVGDHVQNMQEMAGRDRSNHGSRNPNARLTEREVAAIKGLLTAGFGRKEIADAFGVSRPTVSLIGSGRTWRRVNAVTPPAARDLIAAVAEALGGVA